VQPERDLECAGHAPGRYSGFRTAVLLDPRGGGYCGCGLSGGGRGRVGLGGFERLAAVELGQNPPDIGGEDFCLAVQNMFEKLGALHRSIAFSGGTGGG
jgi:hypothetical protein